ncbi:N-acetylmuramoyl-L-alanine amidase [Alkalilimnicola sp. S0819]|uniref:N-acetylmuramoyl-L-alanine amidase n=1 Tax=Alkalilimnicola sp. S0819 TaxID=2613922 RepID=UPI001261DA84|nr:N-acetylmuramoyl-L-alanine amidase [Alkalilimnicola sp. S0819]KAB7624340.1 N-acetylmuramoyl-L-alanine amidase [Alkalilimnicola sp. S0819]MPQ16165.1 N-acetylmuramoyl-L-alanine amidase [Alkalilimnicola sp. S0819]
MSRYRNPQDIDTLVIHCAATPNGKWLTAEQIDRWHAERGFRRAPKLIGPHSPHLHHIGYHFVIYTTGAVTCGRALRETGAHAAGHNERSIGTCLIGTDRFTRAQWETLAAHVRSLRRDYPGIRVVGHRDLSPDLDGDGVISPSEWTKRCPGFGVSAWIEGGMNALSEHLLED